jgi:hypothetical protein
MWIMPRLASIDRLLLRHRRATAVAGVVLILGVVALNAHAALPAHHDRHGDATICIAGLSIAVLAALGWRRRPVAGPARRIDFAPRTLVRCRFLAEPPLALARAGPPGPVVLRR